MKIDLHTHSTASDGSYSPAQIVRHAVLLGIQVLALTDHDTTDGLGEFHQEGVKHGIETLSGLELSVDYGEGSLHLLGYGFKFDDEYLNNVLEALKESRSNRNVKIINKLNELGFSITVEGVARHARNGVMGRPHIAAELVRTGQITSIAEAFDRYLDRRAIAYFDRRRLTLAEGIDLIHAAGGVAVWAHPGTHGDELEQMLNHLPEWKKMGLDGIETDYSAHSVEFRDKLTTLAREHDLIVTGGSDFHGSYRSEVALGQGPQGIDVRHLCYKQLIKRIWSIQNNSLEGETLKTKLLTIILILFALVFSGCSSSPRTPVTAFDPDTTEQGNGGNLDEHGTLFFKSNAATRWVTDLRTSVSEGVLLAENESADTVVGYIKLDGTIVFADKTDLTFVWRGGVSGNTLVYFYISSDGVHWQNAPYLLVSDWQTAPHVLFSSEGIPLTFKFEFRMPPGGRARITEVRAYGK